MAKTCPICGAPMTPTYIWVKEAGKLIRSYASSTPGFAPSVHTPYPRSTSHTPLDTLQPFCYT
jgi:hypothetical protein